MTTSTMDFGSAFGSDAIKPDNLSFDRIPYLKIDGSPGAVASHQNKVRLRFLNDHLRNRPQSPLDAYDVPWISAKQHAAVPTKAKPDDWGDRNWPPSMGCVCRNDQFFINNGMYGDCYVCANITTGTGKDQKYGAKKRTWALAVLREEVIGTAELAQQGLIDASQIGKVVSIRDVTRQVVKLDKDGNPTEEVTTVPAYVKVNFGYNNFFTTVEGFARHYGTVLDRDYIVQRFGEGPRDTEYKIVPDDPTEYDGVKYDLRDEATFREDHPNLPDLREIFLEQASDELYDRFFIPGGSTGLKPKGGTTSSSPAAAAPKPAPTPAAPSTDPTPEALANLQARISGSYDAAPAQQQPEATPEVAAAVATAVKPSMKRL